MSEQPLPETTPVEEQNTPRRRTRKSRRKAPGMAQLLAYIVVNIIVSAATMLAVLFFWEQRTPQNDDLCLPTIAPTAITVEATTAPVVAAIPPLEQEVIQIDIIYGAGYLQDEQVVLKRVGESDLSLYGWWLEDEDGNQFQFPDLILKPGATLNVNSRSGDSTVLALFWGAERSIWTQGETARVYDPQGNLRAEYTIP